MAKEPWRSIAAGGVERSAEPLDFASAMASPCATCETAPCCTFLPVHRLRIETLNDLDYLRYLINFERIELGLSSEGDWSVYYRQPCRFFDRDSRGCTIHDAPEQPNICKNYVPYGCWYRTALRSPVSPGHVRIDHPRMAWFAEHTTFDDDRRIVATPAWDALVAAFAELPYDEAPAADPPLTEPVHERWRRGVIAGESLVRDDRPRTFAELDQPCTGCDAPCCTTVSFPHRAPTNHANVDYLRFLLGFPGVELGVADSGWTIVIHTRCRHLVDHRCSIFGRPERPLACRYYDAHQCAYKVQFGETRPAAFVRVRYDQLPSLLRAYAFDAAGQVVSAPTASQIREAIEEDWRSAAARPVVHHVIDGT